MRRSNRSGARAVSYKDPADEDDEDLEQDDDEERVVSRVVPKKKQNDTKKRVRKIVESESEEEMSFDETTSSDDEEEEDKEDDEPEDIPTKKKNTVRREKGGSRKKSSKSRSQDSDVAEGTRSESSEESFQERTKKKSTKAPVKKSIYAEHSDEDDEEDLASSEDQSSGQELAVGDSVEAAASALRIEKFLMRKTQSRLEWQEFCSKMNTGRVSCGRRIEIQTAENAQDLANGVKRKNQNSMKKLKKMETRYLVKWAKSSYLHVSWETERSLKALFKDPRVVARHIQKFEQSPSMEQDELQDMKTMDRVIDENIIEEEVEEPVIVSKDGDTEMTDAGSKPSTKKSLVTIREYYVKWKSQGFEDATWEIQSDVESISGFEKLLDMFHTRNSESSRLARAKLGKMDSSYKSSRAFKGGRTLRSYQVEAVDWLTFNHRIGRNAILADEMGLGKTCQTVTYIDRLRNAFEIPGPFLIVAPLATLPHWQREFDAWTELNCITYHGSAVGREIIRTNEFYWNHGKTKGPKGVPKFDALVTNYETVLSDFSFLNRFKWSLLVVDEAHRLKNRDSRLTTCLRENFDFGAKLLLTGTPIQNSLPELWTLLNFIEPKSFDNLEKFNQKFGSMTTANEMDKFHEVLRPYMLRRIKSEVEPLPDREDTLIEVELTTMQKRFYRAIYEKNTQYLLAGVQKGSRISLNNVAMELRKCCCHPYLIDGVESKVLTDNPPPRDSRESHDRHIFDKLVESSGKMLLLDKLLPKLNEEGHRVLIFSQMTRMLDILEDYLAYRGYAYERIDGSVRGVDRQFAIDRFSNKSSQSFCFLLSTRGCGQGINLTAADTVIMYDGDWNPQNDVQALARCHRIGQTKKVMVYRLITRKTYEYTMFQRASMKLGLDHAIMTGLTDTAEDSGVKRVSKKEQDIETERLLKYGAYALTDDDDSEAKQFAEANIDEILKSRARHLEASSSETDNRLSKATFVVKGSDASLDIDDPDFWTKVVGLKDTTNDVPLFVEERKARRNKVGMYANNGFAQIPELGDDDESNNGDNDEDYKGDQDTSGRKLWRRKDFNILLSVLYKYGYQKWDEIYAMFVSVIPDRFTLEEVQQAARGFLIFCLFKQDKQGNGGGDSDGEGDSSDEDDAPTTEDSSKLSDFKLVNMRNPQLVERIRAVLEKERYGRVFESIIPELESGLEFLIPDCIVTRRRLENYTSDMEDSDSDDSDEENETVRNEKRRAARGLAYHEDTAKKVAINALKHIRMMDKHALLGEIARKYTKEDGTYDIESFPDAKGILPISWWQPQDDLMLIMGLYKHGWDPRKSTDTFEAIRHDPDLQFTENPDENDEPTRKKRKIAAEEAAAAGAGEDAQEKPDELTEGESKTVEGESKTTAEGETKLLWPTNHRLGLRAKKLVDRYRVEIFKKSTSSKRATNKPVASASSAKAEVDTGPVDQWLKGERKQVYRALLRYGVPSNVSVCANDRCNLFLERFLDLAKLKKKTPEMLHLFVRQLMQDALEIRMTQTAKTLENGFLFASATSARKMLERVNLLRDIRTKALIHHRDDLIEIAKMLSSSLATKKKTSMPSWWTPEHDVALFEGISIHGIGCFQAAEDIRLDESLPFCKICKNTMGADSNRTKEEDGDNDDDGGALDTATPPPHQEVPETPMQTMLNSPSAAPKEEGSDDAKQGYSFPSVVMLMSRIRGFLEQLSKSNRHGSYPRPKAPDGKENAMEVVSKAITSETEVVFIEDENEDAPPKTATVLDLVSEKADNGSPKRVETEMKTEEANAEENRKKGSETEFEIRRNLETSEYLQHKSNVYGLHRYFIAK